MDATVFGMFGTEPIQKFFALLLYLGCGGLFALDCFLDLPDTAKRKALFKTVVIEKNKQFEEGAVQDGKKY